MKQAFYQNLSCQQCVNASELDFNFSFAFQPIIRASTRSIVAYEALARGTAGEPFLSVYQHVTTENLYRFDQACRVKAIKLAAELNMQTTLNINFSPNAVYRPELCIRTTLAAAKEYNFPQQHICFEVTEGEELVDKNHLINIISKYQSLGFSTAIDDFGSGYSGLNLLAEFQPDCIKLDRVLIDGVHNSPAKQAIVKGIVLTCQLLDIDVLAEGVELQEEYAWLLTHGVDLFQGYYFARPGFECLPALNDHCLD
ncbi:MAG: EAL domain-containing protein [Pseudomonadales bacterium]|nr:EAL domain-containing protein [Pseudomonadales bacterium]